MAQTTSGNLDGTFAGRAGALSKALPAPQAYQILRVAFTVAPIVAGLDKFFHLLVDRDMYLAPVIAKLSPVGGHGLMPIAGPVEIGGRSAGCHQTAHRRVCSVGMAARYRD
jgi:hypothetical protein